MLVVHRIELGVFNQPKQMRKFESDGSPGLECSLESSGKAVNVGYMSEYIISDNEIRLLVLPRKLFPESLSEELANHWDSDLLCGICGTVGRFDTEAWDACSNKIL